MPGKVQQVGVPAAASRWVREVFAAANASVSGMLSLNPNNHEPELDMGLIAALNHAPPVAHPAGWTVYIQTHFLGGRRHFYNWEVADIGFLVVFRDRGKVLRIKVALLQSKRLYPTEEHAAVDARRRFEVGFATLLHDPAVFETLTEGRNFTFTKGSRYLALEKGSQQEVVLRAYEQQSRIPVYYLLYNPVRIPLTARVPATQLRHEKTPRVGCRVVPAAALHSHLGAKPDGYHPTFGDVASLKRPFRGEHRAGWRLEYFVADLLLPCREGQVADSTTDSVLETLFYRRSGPIAAAIAVTVDAPADAEFVLPEPHAQSWKSG